MAIGTTDGTGSTVQVVVCLKVVSVKSFVHMFRILHAPLSAQIKQVPQLRLSSPLVPESGLQIGGVLVLQAQGLLYYSTCTFARTTTEIKPRKVDYCTCY